ELWRRKEDDELRRIENVTDEVVQIIRRTEGDRLDVVQSTHQRRRQTITGELWKGEAEALAGGLAGEFAGLLQNLVMLGVVRRISRIPNTLNQPNRAAFQVGRIEHQRVDVLGRRGRQGRQNVFPPGARVAQWRRCRTGLQVLVHALE